MKPLLLKRLLTLALALAAFGPTAVWAEDPSHADHIMGTYNFGTGDKFDKEKTKALPSGSTVINQPKTNHFAWTGEETEIQVHGVGPWGINYVNPADDPRKK